MFVDSRTVAPDTVIETEVCLIGAGAAGMTLAREFIGQPFRVCLLESGGFESDQKTQSLAAGQTIGLPYYPLVTARLRYFGGSTNHWEGWCRPLDESDFERRDWVPHSGWPFPRSHLQPYYERAHPVCELGPFSYDPVALSDDRNRPLPFDGSVLEPRVLRRSPPTRFGAVYREPLKQAENVYAYLHANVLDIEASSSGQTVTRVRVGTLEGNAFWVQAKLFVLAVGGIENARLLLAANRVQPTGLGNQHDLVGRFFMEHLETRTGVILLSDPHLTLGFYRQRPVTQGTFRGTVEGALTLSRDTARRERLLNVSFTELVPMTPSSVEAAGQLGAALRHLKPRTFWKHLKHVVSDLDHVFIAARRKLEGRPAQFYRLGISCEQTPNPESRVTLSTVRDRLGMPQARLEWRLTELDRFTIRRSSELVAQEFGRAGFGRVKLTLPTDEPAWRVYGQWHHMGTTRMHDDPKQGVVDVNGRVYGISNFYVAGSSVFPTSGVANPTLTIVALALRLADHLKGVLA